jgi:hypothetical protein
MNPSGWYISSYSPRPSSPPAWCLLVWTTARRAARSAPPWQKPRQEICCALCAWSGRTFARPATRVYSIRSMTLASSALTCTGPIRSFMRPASRRANLWLLPCGVLQPDSSGPLASGALRERNAEQREEFEFVIIDTPPINHYADATALGPACR